MLRVQRVGSSTVATCRPTVHSHHPTTPASTRAAPSATTCFTADPTNVSSSASPTSASKAFHRGKSLKPAHNWTETLNTQSGRRLGSLALRLCSYSASVKANKKQQSQQTSSFSPQASFYGLSVETIPLSGVISEIFSPNVATKIITWWRHQWRHRFRIDYPWGPYRHTI